MPLVPKKNYLGKVWTVTAQNCNKPGLHTSNIAAAVDREDLHQIPILTLNINFSLNRFHSSLRRRARPKRLWHVTPGPLLDTSPYHRITWHFTVSCVWTKAPSGMAVSPKAIRFSVNMALMGVFTYNKNAWQTQGKCLYAHAIFLLVRNENLSNCFVW